MQKDCLAIFKVTVVVGAYVLKMKFSDDLLS